MTNILMDRIVKRLLEQTTNTNKIEIYIDVNRNGKGIVIHE